MKKHIVIIHEIYGVTDNLLALKKNLEQTGCSVSLPSLYEDNYVGTDERLSYEKFYLQVGLEKSYKIVNKIVQNYRDSEIILIGFSIGATVAWLHSTNDKVNKIIGIYGSRIRNSLDIEPTVKSSLFFCEETLFDIGEIHSILNKKKNVTSKIIPGKHGFYGKVDYDHSMIRKLNEEIFKIIEEQ